MNDKTHELLIEVNKKLDKINDNQFEMTKVLERLTVTVEIHERRSTTLEREVKRIEKEEIEPIADHVKMMKTGFKIIGFIVGSGSFFAVIRLLVGK